MTDFLTHTDHACISLDTTVASRLRSALGYENEPTSQVCAYDPQLVEHSHGQAVHAGVMTLTTNTHDLLLGVQDGLSDEELSEAKNLFSQALDIAKRARPFHLLVDLALPAELTQQGLDILGAWAAQSFDNGADILLFSDVSDAQTLDRAIQAVRAYTPIPIAAMVDLERMGITASIENNTADVRGLLADLEQTDVMLVVVELSATQDKAIQVMRDLQAHTTLPLGVVWNPLGKVSLNQVVDTVQELAKLHLSCVGLGEQASQAQVSASAYVLRYLVTS